MNQTKRRTLSLFSCIVLLFLFLPGYAHAYLDMGSGSYIIQIVLASFLGSVFVFKNFWRRIISIVSGRLFKKKHGE